MRRSTLSISTQARAGPLSDNVVVQQPPSAPPQWSADGQWWWDGAQWRPRGTYIPPAPTPPQPWYAPPITSYAPAPLAYPPPAPGYPAPAPYYGVPPGASPWAPSPGLRIFLMVVLALSTVATGIFALLFLAALAGGSVDAAGMAFALGAVVLLALSVGALIGVAIRAPWSRVVAIVAGAAVSLTCLGLVLGIPIIISAARAPDLTRAKA